MEYPAGNPGVYPVDLTSDIGKFRALVGDLSATPYEPNVPGVGNFTKFSDAEVESYLDQGAGSVARAVGLSYLYLAGQAAIASSEIQDNDLKVSTTKRAADLRAIAQMWFDKADGEDVSSAEEGFEIVPTGTSSGGFIPEGTLPIWGREYTWARWR